jgi:hypothetical protein
MAKLVKAPNTHRKGAPGFEVEAAADMMRIS